MDRVRRAVRQREADVNIAAIDIGSNTILLLVAHFDADGKITPLAYEQRVPRLGRGVDARKVLQQESMLRAVQALQEYSNMLPGFSLSATVVAGTSAVRDAQNSDEFIGLVRKQTGFEVEVLSGDQEAYWTYRGAISGISRSDNATVIDIGGGSTEFTTGNAHSVTGALSLDIGSVRLTERFFKHDPPTAEELFEAGRAVETELHRAEGLKVRETTLVAVAGTATSAAVLDQQLEHFSPGAVTNYRLRFSRVESLLKTLSGLPAAQIARLSTVLEGRSDVITAGLLILRGAMSRFGHDEVIVSERGVRYGLAIREWEKLTRGEVQQDLIFRI